MFDSFENQVEYLSSPTWGVAIVVKFAGATVSKNPL